MQQSFEDDTRDYIKWRSGTGFEPAVPQPSEALSVCWGCGESELSGHEMVSALASALLALLGVFQVAQKVLKNAKQACQRLGQYRMPFAWAAR